MSKLWVQNQMSLSTLPSIEDSLMKIMDYLQKNKDYFKGDVVDEDLGDFDRILIRIKKGQFQIHLGNLVDFMKTLGFELSWIERYDKEYLFWIRFVRR